MGKIGIDVSEHNGTLDWGKIKAAGIEYAIIRGGYGRYKVDSECIANLKGAAANGIPVGIYWFSYALDAASAREEARKCLETISGYDVTLPIYFDFEYDTVEYAKKQGVTLGRQAFNDHAVAFCEAVEAGGYAAGVYYNLDYLNRFVDTSRLGGYSVWYAQYASSPNISAYDIWQYSSSGTISGLSGRFDFNDLKNDALLDGGKKVEAGWKKNSTGWWYVHEDGSYTTNGWEQIDGKWYWFDDNGYMATDRWVMGAKTSYYVGGDGAIVTNKAVKIGPDGGLTVAGDWYPTISSAPDYYRETLEKLRAKGILKGTDEAGTLDMSEDSVRVLVLLDRAGAFGD